MSPCRVSTRLLRPQIGALPSRNYARLYSGFVSSVINPTNKSQIYISRTSDPYLNLSIEHYLLQKTPASSNILFLYTNRPCIVIGRNQNPWLEVNLSLLNDVDTNVPQGVDLVRRRSGGGTVFHDEGNVNYSVICATDVFDRDKHAEMVVRALHKLGVERAKVNCRHDIVLEPQEDGKKPLKISGSAYKLTRMRSVHHGTCLLSSPNISTISRYLRSPAKPYIKARGVDSVSSPIANANVNNREFEEGVISEFREMYGGDEPVILREGMQDVPDIAKGLHELKSLEWTYSQTPQFTFSTHPSEDDPRPRPPLPEDIPIDLNASFSARNGKIGHLNFSVAGEKLRSTSNLDRHLHQIRDWEEILGHSSNNHDTQAVVAWMESLFGKNS